MVLGTIIIIIIIAFLIAALPLHIAAKLMGGKSTLLKAVGVNMFSGIIMGLIYFFLPFASIIAYLALIWIYREMFQLKWFKSFLVWIIQITLTFLFTIILGIFFGINLFF